MSAADKRAYIIADNKIALNADWDPEILALEFQELIDIGFNVSLTGFELCEIDQILIDAEEASQDPVRAEDDHPSPAAMAVSRPGDHWILGPHALVCGDAKDTAVVAQVMGNDQADMVFTATLQRPN